MVVFEILIISMGLSLDVFAYALLKGAMMPKIRKMPLAKMCFIFTLWQTASLLLGNIIASIPMVQNSAGRAAMHWRYLSILIFIGLGLYMIGRGGKKNLIVERLEESIDLKEIVIWACITSVDTFLAGIGFGFFQADFLLTVLISALLTAVGVLVGVWTGYWMGCQARNKFVTLGGCILLIGGIELLVRRIG